MKTFHFNCLSKISPNLISRNYMPYALINQEKSSPKPGFFALFLVVRPAFIILNPGPPRLSFPMERSEMKILEKCHSQAIGRSPVQHLLHLLLNPISAGNLNPIINYQLSIINYLAAGVCGGG